jgi:hypothetical protein
MGHGRFTKSILLSFGILHPFVEEQRKGDKIRQEHPKEWNDVWVQVDNYLHFFDIE